MTPPNVAGLLAEPQRLRVFAAVALGARTAADVERTTRAPAADVEQALRRLHRAGLVAVDPDGYRVDEDALRRGARQHPRPEPESFGTQDAATQAVLRTFVSDGRLVDFPTAWEKKIVVLSYLAHWAFDPGRRYPESAVNEALLGWCTDAPVDHVSVRRYLIDTGVLVREHGEYQLTSRRH